MIEFESTINNKEAFNKVLNESIYKYVIYKRLCDYSIYIQTYPPICANSILHFVIEFDNCCHIVKYMPNMFRNDIDYKEIDKDLCEYIHKIDSITTSMKQGI